MTTPLGDLCQDWFQLGAHKSPGKATIRHAGSPRKWDERDGYGTSGATLTYNGQKLARFEIDIELWSAFQLLEWNVFATLYLAKAPVGVKAKALSITHPQLNLAPLSISAVVVEDCTQFEDDGYGVWKCTIKLIEYRPSQAVALTKPLPPIPGAGPAVETVKDTADEAILTLKAQVLEAKAGGG